MKGRIIHPLILRRLFNDCMNPSLPPVCILHFCRQILTAQQRRLIGFIPTTVIAASCNVLLNALQFVINGKPSLFIFSFVTPQACQRSKCHNAINRFFRAYSRVPVIPRYLIADSVITACPPSSTLIVFLFW